MKKLILTVSLIISIIGLLVTASPFLLRISGFDAPVKSFVLANVMDSDRGSIDVSNFRIGLGNIELEDVGFKTADRYFTLDIQTIRFDFYLHDILFHPTNPQIAIKSVSFIDPKFTVRVQPKGQGTEVPEERQLNNFLRELNKIKNINFIHIKNGEIVYEAQNKDTISIAGNIEGQLEAADSSNLHLALTGRLLSSAEKTFSLISDIHLETNQAETEFEFIDYNLSQFSMLGESESLELDSGLLNGKLKIRTNQFIPDSTSFGGELQVSDFAGKLSGQEFKNINFNAHFANQSLSVNNGYGSFAGSEFRFDLKSSNFIKGSLISEIKFPVLELGPLNGNKVKSIIQDFNVWTSYDLFEKKGRMKLRGAKINVSENLVLGGFKIDLSQADSVVDIVELSLDYNGLVFKGVGNFNHHKNELMLDINSSRTASKHLLFDRLSGKKQFFQSSLLIDVDNKIISGSWNLLFSQPADTLLDFVGSINGDVHEILINLDEKNKYGSRAIIKIINPLEKPEVSEAGFINFPFSRFTSEPLLVSPLGRFKTEIYMHGKFDNLNTNISIVDKKKHSNNFRLTTNVQDLFKKQKQIKGSIQINDLLGFYDFDLTSAMLLGQFNFPAGITGMLDFNLKTEGLISGEVNFDNFNIYSALSDSVVSDDLRIESTLTGNISLSGSVSDPKLEASLTGDKFVFNDVGYYRSELKANASRDKIEIDSIMITINNLPMVEGNLFINTEDKSIHGNLAGSEVDVENLLTTINPHSNYLSGLASFALSLGGTYESPKIAASGSIHEGILRDISFDELNFRFTDQIIRDGKFYNQDDHNIVFSDLSLISDGEFTLDAKGNYPIKDTTPLDVDIHFKGDILKFLPSWVNFFDGGTSVTDIKAHLAGTRSQLRITSGISEIERGELWMKKVVPHVENISGTIELIEGTNEVNFKNISAYVDGNKVVFSTVRDITTSSGKKLLHWYFKDIDLDFGILSIVTEKEGVKLNIPGLMREKDTGSIYLSGKDDTETFYFAGPVKHPVAYGVATLYDTELTYPFLLVQQPTDKKSVAVEFLSNMEWDVLAKSGEDVVYFREIPAYIDNVNAELFVDEKSKGIDFTGIIDDGTFKPLGKMTSSRGRLEYLDQNFKVDIFSVEFTEWDSYPMISGRAWTTIRDSIGAIPKTIYLKLYSMDEETNSERQQGSWENFRFKLESADPQIGESQEQVLAYMGFSVSNFKEKATSVGGSITERYLIRPLLRPIERALEQGLGVDMVRINSNIARNLFYSSMGFETENNLFFNPFTADASYLYLMQSSELTVGKYLSQNLFLTYTGQLVSVYNQEQPDLDVNHSLGLEYRFLRNVLIEFEYDRELMRYYKLTSQKQYSEDFKIRLRHSFTF